jgi:hypothetical protein
MLSRPSFDLPCPIFLDWPLVPTLLLHINLRLLLRLPLLRQSIKAKNTPIERPVL